MATDVKRETTSDQNDHNTKLSIKYDEMHCHTIQYTVLCCIIVDTLGMFPSDQPIETTNHAVVFSVQLLIKKKD